MRDDLDQVDGEEAEVGGRSETCPYYVIFRLVTAVINGEMNFAVQKKGD